MKPDQDLTSAESPNSEDEMQETRKEEIKHSLPIIIDHFLAQHQLEKVNELIVRLVTGLHGEDPQKKENAAIGLAATMASLIKYEEWALMDRLLPAIEQAVSIVGDHEIVMTQFIDELARLSRYHIAMEQYGAARDALMLFMKPSTLAAYSQDLRDRVTLVTEQQATIPVMEQLLSEYLSNGAAQKEKKQQEAGRLLIAFGRKAAEFLMDPLSLDERREERIAILKLLAEIGMPAEDSLCDLLQRSMPWYVTRNIIMLLGTNGNPDCFEDVAHFLTHEDIRVKQEVLKAAGKIDASNKKPFLLQALSRVPKQLTGQVVTLLGDIPDSSIVVPLIDLLEDAARVKTQTSDALQVTTCKALGKIGSVKALPTLKKTIAINRNGAEQKEDPHAVEIVQAATSAIKLIGSGGDQKIQETRIMRAMGVPVTDEVAVAEAAIFRLAVAGDREEATRQLFQLIIRCIEEKDFQNASRLRNRFNEINPMAFKEIIQTAEIIEQAEHGIQAKSYLDVWSNLLDELSAEEFTAIYHEMEERTLQAEELLVNQGDTNDELYFINHGSIKVYYKDEYHKRFIKSLTGGELAGENFFDASYWTVSLSALTPSRISILKRSSFIRWQDAFPGLVEKLEIFYQRSNNIQDLLNQKGLNRRVYQRYRVSRQVKIEMTTATGKSMGKGFSGKLANLSQGGLALVFRIAKQENARVLLGRSMKIIIPIAGRNPELPVNGRVLSIHAVEEDSNEQMIHFVFDQPQDQDGLQSVLG